MKFFGFPTLEQWKKASSVTFAFRSSDKLVLQIDDLIRLYWDMRQSRYEIMYQIYRVSLYWMKHLGNKVKGDEKRLEAVAALNFFIRDRFKLDFKLGEEEFDELMMALFGKPVHVAYEDGEVFNSSRTVQYIADETERRKFKLAFRKKLACKRDENGLAIYDTSEDVGKSDTKGEAIFVMDASWKIYTGSYSRGMFHHSSFLAGGWSLAAGTMKVNRGQIAEVTPDSGHYQPGLQQMLNVTERLRTYGVDLKKVTVRMFTYYTDGPQKGQPKIMGGEYEWDNWRADVFLVRRGIR